MWDIIIIVCFGFPSRHASSNKYTVYSWTSDSHTHTQTHTHTHTHTHAHRHKHTERLREIEPHTNPDTDTPQTDTNPHTFQISRTVCLENTSVYGWQITCMGWLVGFWLAHLTFFEGYGGCNIADDYLAGIKVDNIENGNTFTFAFFLYGQDGGIIYL